MSPLKMFFSSQWNFLVASSPLAAAKPVPAADIPDFVSGRGFLRLLWEPLLINLAYNAAAPFARERPEVVAFCVFFAATLHGRRFRSSSTA